MWRETFLKACSWQKGRVYKKQNASRGAAEVGNVGKIWRRGILQYITQLVDEDKCWTYEMIKKNAQELSEWRLIQTNLRIDNRRRKSTGRWHAEQNAESVVR